MKSIAAAPSQGIGEKPKFQLNTIRTYNWQKRLILPKRLPLRGKKLRYE